jgi:hypothetical protein
VRPGATTSQQQRSKELEREVRELRKTNGILTLASACFAPAELDRHHNTENDAISLPDARWRVKCFGTVTSVAGVAGVAGVGAGVRAGGQDMRAHALPDPGAANAGPGPVWCRMRTLMSRVAEFSPSVVVQISPPG